MDDKHLHHRRSIRMPGYDYSQPGDYFITINSHESERLFGEVIDGAMRLNRAGEIVRDCWLEIPKHYPNVELGEFVVMPNHFHGIITITDKLEIANGNVGAIHELPLQELKHDLPPKEFAHDNDRNSRRRMVIPLIVGRFKMNTAKLINIQRGRSGIPVWQRNYYEHIITSDREYEIIDAYISGNPFNWLKDEEYR